MGIKPDKIKQARLSAGLTQQGAGAEVGTTERQWRRWENGETRMPNAAWQLFKIKIGGRGNDGVATD